VHGLSFGSLNTATNAKPQRYVPFRASTIMGKIYLIFLASALFFLSSINECRAFDISIRDTSAPFKREINNNDIYSQVVRAQNYLGLPTLENGYDGSYIRIWRNAGALLEVTSIYGKDSKWSATFKDLTVNFHPNGYDWVFKLLGTRELTPRSGWLEFTHALFESKLMTLPDESQLPKLFVISDGEGYFIEIANKDSYRFYIFWNPYFLQKVLPEAKYLTEALDLVSTELKNY
jgi:hypothetical protein